MVQRQIRMNYQLVRHEQDEPLFTPAVAAELAGITRQALEIYRRAGLVQPKVRNDSSLGYSKADMRRLIRIRRLREEVELDLDAIEVVLHLRNQVRDLQEELERLRQRAAKREQELLSTVQALRRELEGEARWRPVRGPRR